jgi:hypothetical protein
MWFIDTHPIQSIPELGIGLLAVVSSCTPSWRPPSAPLDTSSWTPSALCSWWAFPPSQGSCPLWGPTPHPPPTLPPPLSSRCKRSARIVLIASRLLVSAFIILCLIIVAFADESWGDRSRVEAAPPPGGVLCLQRRAGHRSVFFQPSPCICK